ncbi:hypothetical protein GCM10011609_71320 [Lentzea pudingi]|uniref:Low temperature requirement A protein (LtrA) n=1 Tax=Lentzea pudingi TaxID=1789439 RepID=A0ABQ2IM52_9PSEU|nr:hypothetical protein [Lentzea pudingi]GGN19921.1 hypothetical protein GCM10011609_71320 [Lentzea pudingi]
MHPREARDVDPRRLELLAAVFFVVDAVVAVQMSSWWMTAAGTRCVAVASLLLVLRQRIASHSVERNRDDRRYRT